MTRRSFLNTMGLGAAGLMIQTALGPPAHAGGGGKRPNILFLFTDDQRFDAVRALNNPEVHTPHMDRLVKQGVAFTHAHIMGSQSGAVCMPSRAMLMSGRDAFHLEKDGQSIPAGDVTLPEQLRKHGYVTFGTGKWHNGRASYARSFSAGANIFFGGMSNHLKVPVHDFDPSGKYDKSRQYVAKKFSSELFSDSAIAFLSEHDGQRPFFAYVSYTAPHDPRMAPKEYADLYPPEKVSLPPNFMPEHPFDNGELRIRDEELAPFPRTPAVVKEHIGAYYAMITHLDAQIGRVLETLEAKGLAEDTIIIFAGDNGLAVGQHGLMGKQNLYEHSVRVPLVFSGPGLPKGEKRDALCYLHDVYPTICGLVGVPTPDSVESKSLVPLIDDAKAKGRGSLAGSYRSVQRMVRDERWKLICYNVKGQQTQQLFDVRNDPWETNNLAGDPDQAERVAAMTALLKEWMRSIDDPCDLDKPNWGV
ncbi:MAG: sulfatase-like hydrolase/transferase [Nitrospiraceae bacterium]|nr:sulfatase-like hydrolase/transferase [Nitrospiraceae bacterium]